MRKAYEKPLGGGLGLQLSEIIVPCFIEDGLYLSDANELSFEFLGKCFDFLL